MSIRFIGTYRPTGRVKIRRAAVAPMFLTQPSVTHADNYSSTTYTAVPGTYSPNNAVLSRRWLLNGSLIGTGPTVVPGAAGSLVLEIKLVTTSGTVTATTTPIAVSIAPPIFTVQPTISPNGGQQGTTFTCNDGAASDSTGISRQWYLNNLLINGATSPTWVSDGTGSLTVKVTAVGPGGTTVATSQPVTVSAAVTVQHSPTWRTQPGLLGTFAEGSSVSIPLQADDQENNISTYTITGGQMPNGLSLDLFSGLIAGTLGEVTADTSYSFQVTVTDRTNLTLTGTFTINVANVKTTVTWNTDNSAPVADTAPGQPVNMYVGASSS